MNETPSQTVGPFFRFGLEWMQHHAIAAPGDPGASEISGVVYDGTGLAVPDAMLEFWNAPHFQRCMTANDGSYRLVVPRPAPIGDQAPHIDVSVFARGLLQRLVTRIYFPDEEAANASDPVLALVPPQRRQTLVASGTGGRFRFDVHLQGPQETVFFAY